MTDDLAGYRSVGGLSFGWRAIVRLVRDRFGWRAIVRLVGGVWSGLGGPAVGVGLVGCGGVGVGGGWVAGGRGCWGAAGAGRLGHRAGRGSATGCVVAAVAFPSVVAGREDVDGTEPGGGEFGPVLLGRVGRVHAEAVASRGVVVELGGDVGIEEGAVIDEGIAAVATIVFGLDEEGGGRELVGGVDGVQLFVVGRNGEVGGIDDDGEVGAGGEGGVDVGGGGRGGDMVVVGMGAEEDGEIGAGGEAHHTDVGGVEVPVGGVGAGEAHGLLRVFEIRGVGGVVASIALGLGDSVLDEDAGDADGVEPVAGVGAFAVGDEDAVAAAGEDEDGGAGVLAVGRVDGEGGDGDVGETDDAAAADGVVGGLGGVGLGLGGGGRLGGGVRPEREREGRSLGVGGGEEEGEDCEDESSADGQGLRVGVTRFVGGAERTGWGEAFHADHTMPSPAQSARVLREGGRLGWWGHARRQVSRFAYGFTPAFGRAVGVVDGAGLWHG